MLVRESSGFPVLSHPSSRVGLPSQIGTAVGRQGDDHARYTDIVIVEDMQGSLGDRERVQIMEEESPAQDKRISDVHMEALNLGKKKNI